MAKPPPSAPHSDISGVNRDARVGVPKASPDRNDAEELEHSNDQARAKPPSDSGSGATGPG